MELLCKDPRNIKFIKKSNNFYNFTCFDILKNNLKVGLIYDILNYCDLIQLKNILNSISIQWNLILVKLSNEYKGHNYRTYKLNNTCSNIDEFNQNIISFINGDKVMAIVCINILLNYLNLN